MITKKTKIFKVVAIVFSIILAKIFLLFLITCFIPYRYVTDVEENGVTYCVDRISGESCAFRYYLSEEQKDYEVIILDNLNDGTTVNTLYAKEYIAFSFEIQGKTLWEIASIDEYCDFDVVEYNVHMKIGKNLNNMYYFVENGIGISEILYEAVNEGDRPNKENVEYVIKINLTYTVDENNHWYYSENGKLYERNN